MQILLFAELCKTLFRSWIKDLQAVVVSQRQQIKQNLSTDFASRTGMMACLHGYCPMQHSCKIREGTTNQVLWVAMMPQCSIQINKTARQSTKPDLVHLHPTQFTNIQPDYWFWRDRITWSWWLGCLNSALSLFFWLYNQIKWINS